MLSILLGLAVQVTQAPAAQRPALTVSVRPANPSVVVGDSIRLAGEVQIPPAAPCRTRAFNGLGGSFEGGNDSTGLVKAGAVGTFVAYAVPSVDGKPARPTPIPVRIVAQPQPESFSTAPRPSSWWVSAWRWTPTCSPPTGTNVAIP